MTVVEIYNNNSVMVSDYWSTATKRPNLDLINNVVMLGYDTDFSTYLNVKYARPLMTGDLQDNGLENGKTYRFALAWNKTPLMSFHGKN